MENVVLHFHVFIMCGVYAYGNPSATAVTWKSEDSVLSSPGGSNTGFHTWQQAPLASPVALALDIAATNAAFGLPSSHSGGISIKASANMDLMRADMGGAATICSAIVSAAKLNLPINIIGKGGALVSGSFQIQPYGRTETLNSLLLLRRHFHAAAVCLKAVFSVRGD